MSKLLCICQGFPPFYGGAEHAAYYLARAAAAAGDEVTVVTSDIGGRLPPAEDIDGMRVVRVHAPKREWTRHSTAELLAFHRRVRRALPAIAAEFQPDRVLAHFTFPAGALALDLKRRCGIPYGVVLHGSDVPGYQPRRFGLIYPFYRPLARHIWKNAAVVIAVSDALRTLALRAWPGGTVHVLPNGVDTQLFQPAASAAPDAGTLHVAVVAQWIERKGIQVLIEALAQLPAALRAACAVHLFGIGPYESTLRQLVAQHGLAAQVHFRGLLERTALAAELQRMQAFVLPSFQEGLPLAVIEAMACGLPVIATGVGGLPAFIGDSGAAVLVPPRDAAALAQALARVLPDAAARRDLGRRARLLAESYDWAHVWRQYAALLYRTS